MMPLGRAVLLLLLLAAEAVVAGCDRKRGWVQMRQRDFVRGTYQITEPGNYCLSEDVTFNPNSLAWMRANVNRRATAWDSSDPLPEQFTDAGGEYATDAFAIGFFAAITVAAKDVVIDLNGNTLEQSTEHALQQRFFALIELADRPFRGGQGPHSFGTLVPAERVTVRNGKLGRSAHHGIHGNDAVDVLIEDIKFDGFEVAAVALNNVAGLRMENTKAWSRIDVPIMGPYASGRFSRPLLDCLAEEGSDVTLDVYNGRRMETLTVADVRDALAESMQNVFDDVVIGRGSINSRRHPDDYALYHNPTGTVDGNAYGYLINGQGVAVLGFPSLPVANPSTTVHLKNVELNRLWASITEVPALWNEAGTGPVRDTKGATFQLFRTHPTTGEPVALSTADVATARYTGNVVMNAQAIISKAVHEGFFGTASSATSCRNTLEVFRSSISETVIDWVEGRIPFLQDLMDQLPNTGVVCNGDTMFHVNKGVIGFKMDGGEDVVLEDVTASNVMNFGKAGEAELCGYGEDEFSHPRATLPGFNGADVRAFSFSGSQRVTVDGAKAEGISAAFGSAIGFDVFGGTIDVQCNNCDVDGVHAGSQAESLSQFTGPNRIPVAACYREADDTSDVAYDSRSRCEDVSAPSPATPTPRRTPSPPSKGKGKGKGKK